MQFYIRVYRCRGLYGHFPLGGRSQIASVILVMILIGGL